MRVTGLVELQLIWRKVRTAGMTSARSTCNSGKAAFSFRYHVHLLLHNFALNFNLMNNISYFCWNNRTHLMRKQSHWRNKIHNCVDSFVNNFSLHSNARATLRCILNGACICLQQMRTFVLWRIPRCVYAICHGQKFPQRGHVCIGTASVCTTRMTFYLFWKNTDKNT